MANERPPRAYLGNVQTGTTLSAQYNPDSLEEELSAVYQKVKVQGLSHEVLQYEHTKSHDVSFDLAFDALSNDAFDVARARNWLMSLLLPVRGAGSVASGSPPRVLFVWPGLFAMTSVIEKLKVKHKRFSWFGVDLASTWFVASFTLTEIRDTRLFSDDVLRNGTIRS